MTLIRNSQTLSIGRVYNSGCKRVYVKIEKGNNILVRVGGGFMKIGDSKPLELEQVNI